MDYQKLQNVMQVISEFEKNFNSYLPGMRGIVNKIAIPYQNLYAELLFNLYSDVYELCQTHDMDDPNISLLKTDYDLVVVAYSDYLKLLDMLEIENKDFSLNFNDLKDIMDDINDIFQEYRKDIMEELEV